MRRMLLTGSLALAAGVTALMAQGQPAQPAQAQPGQAAPPAQAGPRPKSQEELKAVQALGAAQQQNNPDAIIKAAEDLLTNFADTQFKELALTMEASAYQMKGDNANAQVAWERVLEVNPKSPQANLKLGGLLATQTSSKALDRDEKLAQAEKYLHTTQDLLSTMAKPNPALTDEQWTAAKQQLDAELHNDLGMIGLTRAEVNKDDPKRYDAAINDFQTAAKEDPEQAAYGARLASTLQAAGKNAEAIAECDKILAMPELHPQIKDFVTKVKAAATKAGAAPAK